jgi:hypothetical protein
MVVNAAAANGPRARPRFDQMPQIFCKARARGPMAAPAPNMTLPVSGATMKSGA